MRTLLLLPVVLVLALLAGCDSDDATPDPDPFPFNPDTLDFDAVSSLDFDDYVQPLLAYRNVFGSDQMTPEDRLPDYAWDVLFEGDTEPGATVIPFDADESLLLKLVEDLPEGAEIPYPALRDLEDDEVRYLRRWIEAGAPSSDGTIPFADAEAVLYVCNQLAGRVAVVDAARRQVIRYVYLADLGEAGGEMGALPHDAAVAADGSAWFVTLIAGTGGGSILRLSTDLTLDPADPAYLLASETPPVGDETFQKPGMIVYDDVNDRLFVGRSFSADANSQGIGRLDAGTMDLDVLSTLNASHPHAVNVSADGRWAFTASLDLNNAVEVYDAANGDLVDVEFVSQDDDPSFVQYAVSPDGATVALTSQTTARLYLFDFDTATGDLSVAAPVGVGMQPWHPAFAPSGTTVYVPNRLSHNVSFVDVSTQAVAQTVGNEGAEVVFSEPHGSAVTADGRYLFVSNRNLGNDAEGPIRPAPFPFEDADGETLPDTAYGFVTVIDTQTGEVVEVIPMGTWASGMAIYDPR